MARHAVKEYYKVIQMNVAVLYISSAFTPVKSMSQLVLSRSASKLAQTDVFAEEVQVPEAQVAFLHLVFLFLFCNIYVCFNMNYIVVTH